MAIPEEPEPIIDMAEVCDEPVLNIGIDKCGKVPQLLKKPIEAPKNFKFTAAQLADPDLLKAALEDLIYGPAGSRGYLWPDAADFVNNSEAENIYQETQLKSIKVRKGKIRFRYFFDVSLCLHAAMFSHDGSGDKAFFHMDVENMLWGQLIDGELYPFTAAFNNMENLRLSDGQVATMSPMYLELANSDDLNKRGGGIDVGAFINLIQPLTDVNVTEVGTSTATQIVVDVKAKCDGTAVNGLVTADFVKTGAGSISGVVETGNGRYTITGTGFASGTIDLDTPDALSVKGWESVAPATVTI